MSRIRAEQIQDLTIRDQNISETANIDQSKIEDWQSDMAGWLSQGIVKAVPNTFFTNNGAQTFDAFWDGSQSGQLYYDTDNDELWIGTSTDPYHNLVAGHGTEGQEAGWDSQIVVQMGNEATDYNGDDVAIHIGTADLSTGYDWSTTNETFNISVNGGSTTTVTLDTATTDVVTTVTEVNNALGAASVSGVEAFADGNNIGIRTTIAGGDQSFVLSSGTGALTTLGWSTGTYTGSDGTNLGTVFDLGVDLATDGTNMMLYLNGALMENATDGDYQITGPQTIQFNYDIYGEDKVTAIIYSDASFTNYATKAYVDNLFYSDSGHDHDGVSTPKLNFNESMEVTTDIDGVIGNNGVLINHNLVPTVDTRNIGSPSNYWGNIYVNEGHFAASSIFIDNAKLRFNTTDGSLEISEDGGATYAKVAKKAQPGEATDIYAESGQKVVLQSDTAIELQGDVLPDTNGARDIGSNSLRFALLYANDAYASTIYVNDKKAIEDQSSKMTLQTSIDETVRLLTTSSTAGLGSGNIEITSGNQFTVSTSGNASVTIDGSSGSAKVLTLSNQSGGNISLNTSAGNVVTNSSIEPATDGVLHIGGEGKAFNDIFVNTILFRPLAEAQDFAKIDSEIIDTSTLVKHQIGATASDAIIFQGNNGTSTSDLMSISGDGVVTISGDLVVNGSTTTVQSVTTQVNDSSFVIHHSDTPIDGDASYEVQRASGNAKLQWNDTTHLWEVVEGSNADITREVTNPTRIDGVNFHQDTVDPTGTTRLNMDGYFYATRVYNAVYNDLAEFMYKAEESEAGDVVVMTENGLVPSSERLDGAVVGVYSDSYGYALGAEDAENKIPVAISGRVWVKIAEPCKIGDLLVSGKRGRASVRRSGDDVTGKVIGKVLKNKSDYEEERIEMLVMNS